MINLTITETAQEHFTKLLKDQEEGTNIRIFVVNPGTMRAECGVSYCPENAVEDTDIEMKFENFSAFIDDFSYEYLDDAVIDFVIEEMGSQLTMKAPNAKMKKVADDAPLIERLDYVIQTQINPELAGHGGVVTLVDIQDGIAILQFGGGCNGCSMIDVTLKQGIEKQLIAQFEGEIFGVKDATEHQAGEHSYY